MKNIFAIFIIALISGCSSPTPNFFQPVSIVTGDRVYPELKGIILLNNVLIPAEASRPQITTLGEEDYEVKIDEFNRWGASLEKLVMRVLNNNLGFYFPNAVIENQSSLRKNYKYAIAVEITEISGRLDDIATLKASYFIKNKNNNIIKSARFANSIKIDGDYDEYVPAISRLLGELAEKIAQDLPK